MEGKPGAGLDACAPGFLRPLPPAFRPSWKMASRAGPRATGTDGSDFRHRERVAEHYQMRWGRERGQRALGALTPAGRELHASPLAPGAATPQVGHGALPGLQGSPGRRAQPPWRKWQRWRVDWVTACLLSPLPSRALSFQGCARKSLIDFQHPPLFDISFCEREAQPANNVFSSVYSWTAQSYIMMWARVKGEGERFRISL